MKYFADTDISLKQHTLADTIVCSGNGLHSGLKVIMALWPAEPNTGIEFVRRDVSAAHNTIAARWDNVSDTQLSTTISNSMGIRVSTIEHLMAALHGCGVDNARIVIDGPEIPIMDGSSAPFVEAILKTGLKTQQAYRSVWHVKRAVSVSEKGATASLTPSLTPWMDMAINFSEKPIGQQSISLPFLHSTFNDDIARARTFGFEKHLAELKRRGLARGSSLENAILVTDDKVVNYGGLRFGDEFVRHKYLDAVGDLALAGLYIVGHFKGNKSGHRLNNLLLREAFAQKAIERISIHHAQAQWQDFINNQNSALSISA